MMKQSLFALIALGAVNGLKVSQQQDSPMPEDMNGDMILAQTFDGEDQPAPVDLNEEAGELAQTSHAYAYAQTMGGHKSVTWNQPVKVTFVNESDQDLELMWYNYQGIKVSYGIIKAGGHRQMHTYATHPWDVQGHGTFYVDGDDVWVPEAKDAGRTIYIEEYTHYKSINSKDPRKLTFKNEANVAAEINWHNYQGDLVNYGTLGVNHSYVQHTYATHPWSAVAPDGMCLTMNDMAVYDTVNDDTVYINNYKSTAWNQPIVVTFDNQSDETIELFWHNYQGNRVSYGHIGAGMSRGMRTYVTHPWSATGNGEFSVKNKCVFDPQLGDHGRVVSIRKLD